MFKEPNNLEDCVKFYHKLADWVARIGVIGSIPIAWLIGYKLSFLDFGLGFFLGAIFELGFLYLVVYAVDYIRNSDVVCLKYPSKEEIEDIQK